MRKLFWGLGRVSEVELINSKIPGIKPRLTESREPCELVTLLLPDYGLRTISALLDLLYKGRSKDCGQYTGDGELELVGLYKDLGVQKEYGGLPTIENLEEVEVFEQKSTCKSAQVIGEVVSSTTQPEEERQREDSPEDFILVSSETPEEVTEILLSSENLDKRVVKEDQIKHSLNATGEESNDVGEEDVFEDDRTGLADADSVGREKSRLRSPEPEIDELLGEESDSSRPASQTSNEGDLLLTQNPSPVLESVVESQEEVMACASSPEIQDKSKGKRICLRKKSSSESDPDNPSSFGFTDTDVEIARLKARKRRRSSLGEEYDSMKSKQRRLSKKEDEKEKRPLLMTMSGESLVCPLNECGKEIGGDSEKIAKHLIKHHLSKPPSCLYAEEKDSGNRKCKPCNFSSSSLSSFWAHMAVKHR